jgi:uncharacterized protein (TIGR03067 family)
MKCYILIAVALSLQVAHLHAQGDAAKGSKELQGEWRAIELESSGTAAPKEALKKTRLEINGDEMIWHSGGASERKSRISLNPGKSPKEIDITILEGPSKGTTFPGIYSLENGQLRLCYSHTKDRPKEFKTERGQLRELVILERARPK